MEKLLRGIAIGALVFLASNSFAQQYNLTGAGARAEGFGGAFIGVADDATAVVWNPGGLTQLERPEASVVARSVSESWDYKYSPDATFNWTAKQSHFVFNFASLAVPFKLGSMKMVAAAAYQRQLDWYDTWDSPTDKYTTSGGVDTFTPGLGVQVAPAVSVGVAANIWFGKNKHDENYSWAYSPTGQEQWNYDGTYSGLNFVLGAMLDLGGLNKPIPLKIGACVKTPFTLKADFTYQYDPPKTGFESGGFFYNYSFGSITTYGTHGTIQMPLMLGFGASYRIGENLTVAADYEMRSFGSKKIDISYNAPYDQYFLSSSDPMSQSGKNLNQVRFGAEYLIVADIGVFPLRAGYFNLPSLNGYQNSDNTYSQIIGAGFSVGTGYISERFALDATYSQSTTDYGSYYDSDHYVKSTISASLIFYF